MPRVDGAFYTDEDGTLVPSELTRGPWDAGAQHAGPPAALLGRALERCEPREGLRLGRVTFEILGPVPLAPLRASARVVRPGRSVELLEASLSGPDGEVMRAAAWRLQVGEVQLAEEPGVRPAGPEQGVETGLLQHGAGGRLPDRDGVSLRERRLPGAGPGDRMDEDSGSPW